jgi:HNH endonuclease
MFGECWYEIPGVRELELSGDLRFRGPRGFRKLRHDCHGRPYIMANKAVGHVFEGEIRAGRVMLHRAVMTLVLGRELGRGEFVCHRDDDVGNNWPDNLYLGDRQSNAADSLRNGGRLRGDRHPFAKILEAQVREIRSALSRGQRGVDLARVHGVHRSTISRIKHGVRRRLTQSPDRSE